MKKTSVTPSATFDQIPSPSQSVKIGASTTRGSALTIFTYGSNTAAVRGWRANQKPTSTPPIDPITKASIDSDSVTQRCFQITPETNQATICCATSTGFEKKNGGRTTWPKIGQVVRTCQSTIATTATRICNKVSLTRSIPNLDAALWPPEQPDEPCSGLGMALELLLQLIAREPSRQRAWLQISRDEHENIMVKAGAWRRARPAVNRLSRRFLAAGEFVGCLAEFVFGESCH